jgi:ABC-2 type transport system ATP-binding protein
VTAAIECHALRKEYGRLLALDGLTFSTEAGTVLGVLGPNGAGKTTAIRMLTTVLPPTGGTFSVAGIPSSRAAGIRSRIGVLPEGAGYPERQTGEEYLRYHARLFGRSPAEARNSATRLLDEVGLAQRGRDLIGRYSRGMRQRLGVARALINDPDVIFLDEPTLGLDPAGQRQILSLIRTVSHERGATVLLSTHLLDEVEEVCGRVLILDHGQVVAEGTVAEVARRAAAPRSARLRVAPDQVDQTIAALSRTSGIGAVQQSPGLPGSLVIQFSTAGSEEPTQALRELARAGVSILLFELEGARLDDAFLAVTGRSSDGSPP